MLSLWVSELSWLRHTNWFTSNETRHCLPFETDRDPQLGFREVSRSGVELSRCSAPTTARAASNSDPAPIDSSSILTTEKQDVSLVHSLRAIAAVPSASYKLSISLIAVMFPHLRGELCLLW